MPKANLVLPDGTKVTIEGNTDEVGSLLARLSFGERQKSSSGTSSSRQRSSRRVGPKPAAAPAGPTEHIRELIGEGYFKSKREIGAVRDKLEERAHIYPVTSISGPLFRLVKSKELRRLKEDGVWRYVNR